MSEYAIQSIDLSEFPSKRGFEFLEAQWWDERSPLTVICFSYHGRLTKLRMDLDKMTFIDHLSDTGADEAIQRLAGSIWKVVARKRFGAPAAEEERAHEFHD